MKIPSDFLEPLEPGGLQLAVLPATTVVALLGEPHLPADLRQVPALGKLYIRLLKQYDYSFSRELFLVHFDLFEASYY